jgi:TRAP-type mannitol/chloroaromatic compound transport system substrate-binding protein
MSKFRSEAMRVAVAGAALLAGGLLGTAAHAQQAASKALTMQASWPASSTFMENFTLFADRVQKTTGGRVTIKTSAAGTIVPAFEVTDATHKGVLDGAHTWSGYLIGKHPAAVLFTGGPGGPFGMDLFDHLGWFYDGGGQQLMDEWFETIIKRDVISLPVMPFTPQMFGWFKQPFKGWADLKGRKIRAVGMNAQLLNSAGAAVVSMPGGEIVPAAQRGVIDAAEWCCPAEDVKLGFHQVWKYYYMPSMHEMTEVADLILSKATFKALPADQQEIIKMAATETYLRWRLTNVRENSKALGEMREKHGVNVRRTPPEVLIKQLETWDAIREKFAKEDPFFAKVVESQRKYAAVVVPGRQSMFPSYNFAADYYWRKKPEAKPAAKSSGK